MSIQYVIVGASAASMAVINKLVRLVPEAQIICIAGQYETPYNKCLLADYLAGTKDLQSIQLITPSNQGAGVIFKTGISLKSINPTSKTIMCSDDSIIAYDRLFLGMGGNPFIPPFMPTEWHKGIFTFHTLADANKILDYVAGNHVAKAVIIGAGLSGIECADVLQKKGIDITIVERQPRILHQFLNNDSAQFLVERIQEGKGRVFDGQTVVAIQGDLSKVTGVQLASGQLLEADLVILATGIRPNIQIAQNAGIVSVPQGVLVNQYMQTSIPDIYAAGDLIAITNTLTGEVMTSSTWPDAMLQGIHAAQAMVGQPKPYLGAAIIASSAFFGLNFAQAGLCEPQNGDQVIVKKEIDYCHRFILRNGALKGFSVLGNAHNLGMLRKMILTGQAFDL